MKVRRAYALCAILLALTATSSLSAQLACSRDNVGLLQRQAVLASIPRYLSQDSSVVTAVNNFKVEASVLQGVMDSAYAAYQEKALSLPPAARQIELRKLDAQNVQVQQRIKGLQAEVSRERDRLLQPIELGVQAIVDTVRIEQKCPLVLDVSSGTGIVSINKKTDITQQVIDRIRVKGDTSIFGPPLDPKRKPGTW